MCTQDDRQHTLNDEVSTASPTIEQEAKCNGQAIPDEKTAEPLAPLTSLNPWVQKAIRQAQYTPEQIVVLRAQRQKVIDAIAAAEGYIETLNEDSSATLRSRSPVTSPSIDTDPSLPDVALVEFLKIQEPEPSPAVRVPSAKLSVFPHCKLQYCQNCRPTFRDRAWMSFEDVMTRPNQGLEIDFKRDNRPISHPNHVRKLGVHKTSWPRPPLRSFHGLKRYSTNLTRQSSLTNQQNWRSENVPHSSDLADQRTEPESKGFRDGVKRAFRGMLMHRRRSTSTTSSLNARIKEDDSSEWNVGLWKDLNDELLHEASNVPLPGHDGMDGLGGEEGEIEVEEGVAVTEEGVDLGMADVIMSV